LTDEPVSVVDTDFVAGVFEHDEIGEETLNEKVGARSVLASIAPLDRLEATLSGLALRLAAKRDDVAADHGSLVEATSQGLATIAALRSNPMFRRRTRGE
jgi:hypothetical protein